MSSNERPQIRVVKKTQSSNENHHDLKDKIVKVASTPAILYLFDENFQKQCKYAGNYLFNCTNYTEFNKFPDEIVCTVLAHIIENERQGKVPKYKQIVDDYLDIPANKNVADAKAQNMLNAQMREGFIL